MRWSVYKKNLLENCFKNYLLARNSAVSRSSAVLLWSNTILCDKQQLIMLTWAKSLYQNALISSFYRLIIFRHPARTQIQQGYLSKEIQARAIVEIFRTFPTSHVGSTHCVFLTLDVQVRVLVYIVELIAPTAKNFIWGYLNWVLKFSRNVS